MEIGKIELSIEGITKEETLIIQEILFALISSGGLLRIKRGRTIIHFDEDGSFQGIELNYWPWRKRGREDNTKAIKVM